VLRGEAQKGEKNLFKLILIVLAAIFSIPNELPNWGTSEVEATETVAVSDAFACPNPLMMLSYFDKGLSDETADCSAIAFADFESKGTLGWFPVDYFDWASLDGDLQGPPEVEMLTGSYEGLEVFVIVDLIDEHILEEKPGLRRSVAYTVWKDHPPSL
jgi:hypothetical protein